MPALTLSLDPMSISEAGGVAVATVTRDGADLTAPVEISVSVDDPTAATAPTTVVIAAGETTATFEVAGVDDALLDGDQVATVSVAAAGHTGAAAGLTVTDDEVAEEPASADFIVALVDASADAEIALISDGSTIDPGAVSAANLTLTADYIGDGEAGNDDGSIQFELADATGQVIAARTENVAPFALFGDRRGDFFNPNTANQQLVDGAYTLTVTATDGNNGGGSVLAQESIAFTIGAEISSSLTLLLDPMSISEAGGVAVATVTRDGADLTAPVEISISVDDPTAATAPTTVVIAAGETTATFEVAGVDDALLDGDQVATVSVAAAGHTGAAAGLTVTDDEVAEESDPILTLLLDPMSISEAGGVAVATVTRDGVDLTAPVEISVSVDDPTAATAPTTVVIAAGETTATFEVAGVDDALLDGDQVATVSVAAAGHTGAAAGLTVTDDEVAEEPDPILTLLLDPMSISEAGGVAVATVTRDGVDLTAPVEISVSVDDPTAATAPTTVVIAAGETTATFEVAGVDDALLDGDQVATVSVAAAGHTGAAAGLTVTDDEVAEEPDPILTLLLDPMSISEAGGVAVATVTRDGADLTAPVEISVSVDDPTAATAPTTVVIAAGETTATFEVAGVDDALLDGDQVATVGVAAAGHTGATAGLTVTDDEVAEEPDPILTLLLDPMSISEAGGVAVATVTRDGADLTAPVEISISVDDATAATAPTTVVIAAGETTATFEVAGVDDALLDGDQVATVGVAAAGHTGATAGLTVTDDEVPQETLQWHKVTLDFQGPLLAEAPETFTDYRLDVILTHQSGLSISVPGFFAADGDAANTGATQGNVWRAHFNPPEVGEWTWTAKFRTGDQLAISDDPGLSAGFFDGASGTFVVAGSDKTGADLRGKGVLEYVGGRYLEFAGTDEVFLKSGVGSPENFLAYSGFDATPQSHDYGPHIDDFQAGDPTWADGRGQGIIGAVNYLASQDVNSAYMMLMNIGGDGRDVSPWVDPTLYDIERNPGPLDLAERAQVFDVSKLDQWEIVFEHMQERGIVLHLFLQETENDQLLNDGDLGNERMLFIRELVARFSHHNGVIWNLGEENSNSTQQLTDHSAYLKALDPYEHAVALHTFPSEHSRYESFQGSETLDALSFQTSTTTDVPDLDRFVGGADLAGRSVVAFLDEPGSARVGLAAEGDSNWETNYEELRSTLWKFYAEGGSGAEWYFGYATAGGSGGDLLMEDFRLREEAYEWSAAAREFFEMLPLQLMTDGDGIVAGAEVHGLALDGHIYAYFLPNGGAASLDLSGQIGTFRIGWYSVETGGDLVRGTVDLVEGDGIVPIGLPPYRPNSDWAVLIWNTEGYDFAFVEPTAALTLSLDPMSISEAGGVAVATVTRDGADLTAPVEISISVDDPTAATAPTTVVIAAGETTATFEVAGVDDALLDGDQVATVSVAAAGHTGAAAGLTVTDDEVAEEPDPILTLLLDPMSISEAGGVAVATVTRDGVDLTAPVEISVSVDDPTAATAPTTVVIAAGETTAAFEVAGVDDALLDGDQVATVSVAAAGHTGAAAGLTVTDDEVAEEPDPILTLLLDPMSISEAGGVAVATVTRDGVDLTAPVEISVSVDDPTAATAPTTVVIAAGETTATFEVAGVDDALLDGDQVATVSVAAAGHTGAAAGLTVTDDEVAEEPDPILTLLLDPMSISEAGGVAVATVTRDGADLTAPVEISVSVDDPTAATAPTTVVIAAGETTATFEVAGVDDALLDGDQVATVSVAAAGHTGAAAGLTVTDDEVAEEPASADFIVALVDASADAEIALISDGSTIDPGAVSAANLTLTADYIGDGEAGNDDGSIQFELADATGQVIAARTENVAPFALFGDRRGDFFNPNTANQQLVDGAYTLTVTATDGNNGGGSVLAQESIAFTIGSATGEVVKGVALDGVQSPGSSFIADQSGIDGELLVGGGNQVGFLFADVFIPKDAVVSSASLDVNSRGMQDGPSKLIIALSSDTSTSDIGIGSLMDPSFDSFEFLEVELNGPFSENETIEIDGIEKLVQNLVDSSTQAPRNYDLTFRLSAEGDTLGLFPEELGNGSSAMLHIDYIFE